MKKTYLIGGIAAALLLSTVSFAATSGASTTITNTANGVVTATAAAATQGMYGTTGPTWSPVANTNGSIGTGDLFIVDATSNTSGGNIDVTVYFSNAGALQQDYSTLNETIQVYQNTGTWGAMAPVQTKQITLQNGSVEFELPAGSKYSISVDSGYYTCVSTSATGGSISPSYDIIAKDL